MDKPTDNKFIFQFNNQGRSSGFFVIYILCGFSLLAASCVFIFTNLNVLLLISIFSTLLFITIFHLYKPSYFELLVSETSFKINFYSVATAIKSYHTVEIELDSFKGFEVRKRYAGLQKQLILTIGSKLGLADYPPISISILRKNELSQVITVLTKIKKQEI